VLTEHYLVRIYRREEGDRRCVVGVIETVESGWQKPFQSLQQLSEILAKPYTGSPEIKPGDQD